jgi:hypothetical protein
MLTTVLNDSPVFPGDEEDEEEDEDEVQFYNKLI